MALAIPKRLPLYPALLFMGLGVLIAVGIVAAWNTVQLVTTIRQQQERMEVRKELGDIRKVLQLLDANEQYYTVTGNEEYFKRLEEAIPELLQEKKQFNELLDAKYNNGSKNLQIFNYLLSRKAKLMNSFVAREKQGANRIMGLRRLTSRENRQLSKDLRAVMAAIDITETQAINSQDIIVDRYSLLSMIAIVAGLIVAIGLVAVFGWRSWREIERRTRSEADLRKAQEAAVVSSKLKSQFLATVSHEIRTPLNGIIGLSDLLREQVKSSEEKRLAKIIHSSGQSLLRIVNDILDFSKIEAGKIELEIQNFNIRSVVQSALELHNLKARSKSLFLMGHLEKEIPAELFGDSARLTQVLNNLIGNAIKFTDKGEVIVRGKMLRDDSSKVFLQFSVEDTGVGISKEEQSYLFQPFNQVSSVTNNKEEGTGLGLSICKTIVEKMGGSIRVYSRPGLGSQFIFEVPFDKSGKERLKDQFPKINYKNVIYVGRNHNLRGILQTYSYDLNMRFYSVESKADFKRAMSLIPSNETTACLFHPDENFVDDELFTDNVHSYIIMNDTDMHLSKYKRDGSKHIQFPITRMKFIEALNSERDIELMPKQNTRETPQSEGNYNRSTLVLVVEDNPTNQILIQSYLDKLGFRSHMAAHGKEALISLEQTDYDVILMDCRMPIMDGFETTERIRQIEASSGHRTPIIAMTANAMQGDRDKCLSAGMDDYISKPFESQDILNIIKKWTQTSDQVDEEVLKELAQKTTNEVVHKMLESFVTTLTESLKVLRKAQAEGDDEQIQFHSHKLKSSSASLGAIHFSELCSNMEVFAENKNVDPQKLSELIEVGDKVLVEIKRLAGIKNIGENGSTSGGNPRQSQSQSGHVNL